MSDDLPKEDKAMSQHTVTAPATAKPVPPYMVTMQATESGEARARIRMALDRLDRYMVMTKPQNERIWEAQRRSHDLTMGETFTHESMTEGMLWLERSWVEAHSAIAETISKLHEISGSDIERAWNHTERLAITWNTGLSGYQGERRISGGNRPHRAIRQ